MSPFLNALPTTVDDHLLRGFVAIKLARLHTPAGRHKIISFADSFHGRTYGALAATGRADALTRNALVTSQGFKGTSGIFRLLSNGPNQRGLAVATIRNNQVVILDPAPTSFRGAGL